MVSVYWVTLVQVALSMVYSGSHRLCCRFYIPLDVVPVLGKLKASGTMGGGASPPAMNTEREILNSEERDPLSLFVCLSICVPDFFFSSL